MQVHSPEISGYFVLEGGYNTNCPKHPVFYSIYKSRLMQLILLVNIKLILLVDIQLILLVNIQLILLVKMLVMYTALILFTEV